MCETAAEQIDQKWRGGKKTNAFQQWRQSASQRVKSGKFVLLLCPLDVNLSGPSSVPSFLYLESNIRLGNLDDSGFPSLDRGGIVIGMPRKEARGHRRPDSVDRGRGGEGGDITDCRKKK